MADVANKGKADHIDEVLHSKKPSPSSADAADCDSFSKVRSGLMGPQSQISLQKKTYKNTNKRLQYVERGTWELNHTQE